MRNLRRAAASACLLCACVLAQEPTTSPALEKAIVVEEAEHDLEAACALYDAIARDARAPAAIRGRAWLRLGRARQKLGEDEAARAALEEAVRAGGAVAEEAKALLQDPGRDEERARLVRERARALVGELVQEMLRSGQPTERVTRLRNDLLWIGRAAVPEIVREIHAQREAEQRVRQSVWSALASLLWEIGGDEAAAFFTAVRGDAAVEFRRAVVQYVGRAQSDAMVAQAQAFLADADPEGTVPQAAVGSQHQHNLIARYDLDAVIPLLESPVAAVRVAVLVTLQGAWNGLRHAPDPAATTVRLTPHLARGVRSIEPAESRAATELLLAVGLLARPSRRLLIEIWPELGRDAVLQWPKTAPSGFDGPADEADRIMALLGELGPAEEVASRRDGSLGQLLSLYARHWKRAAFPVVLEAARLGYMPWGNLGQWLKSNATAEDAPAITSALAARPEALEGVMWWLSDLPSLPAACWPDLRPHIEAPKGLSDESRLRRYVAAGKTGHPEVPGVLLQQLAGSPAPALYGAVAAGCLWFSEAAPGEAARDALRRIATHAAADDGAPTPRGSPEASRQMRNQLFARLVRMGDAAIINQLPLLHRLGMRASSPFPLPSNAGAQANAAGLDWLVVSWRDAGDQLVTWHGYDGATYAHIVALLLEPENGAHGHFWTLLDGALRADWSPTAVRSGRRVPQGYHEPPAAVIEVGCKAWARRCAYAASPSTNELDGLVALLDIGRRRATEDAAALAAIADLHAACHRAASPVLRSLALEALPDTLSDPERERLVAALGDADPEVAALARQLVRSYRIPISPNLLAGALASESAEVRAGALQDLAPVVEGDATALVTPLLHDPVRDVRAAACRFLGTQMRPESVTDLLAALKDPDAMVREAAGGALTAIRFYHDEKAHWDRVFAGAAGVTRNGAAEALLAQAAPDRDAETRVLAIRSLGQLGVPETLPFLIDWASGEDEAVAQEARAAIARIHAQNK